jgi:replicative DNA helicase
MLRFLEEIGGVGKKRAQASTALLERLEKQRGRSARDMVPAGIWSSIVRPAQVHACLSDGQLQAAIGLPYSRQAVFEHDLSRARTKKIATALGSDDLMRIARSDVYWDKVVSIQPDGEEDVYDLTVDGLHNFVANDIILHNSIEQDADLVMFLYRDEYYNREKSEKQGIAEILVAKHRNGPTGSVELAFRKELTRFENLDRRRAEVENAEP